MCLMCCGAPGLRASLLSFNPLKETEREREGRGGVGVGGTGMWCLAEIVED